MGKEAIELYDTETKQDDIRGFLVADNVLATIHPGRAARHIDSWMRKPFQSDIFKFKRLMNGERAEKPALFVNDLGVLGRIRQRCDGNIPIAVDIETDGKRVYDANPTLIALADTLEAVSFSWPSPSQVADILAYPAPRKVFQNGFWFDIPILGRLGYSVHGEVEDIRDLRRALSSDSPLSLNYIASIYLLIRRWKREGYTKDPLGNAEDALRTAQLWELMEREMIRGD